MARSVLEPWADSVRRELLGNILPFWRTYALDEQHGGFVAELANDRTPRPGATKGLILNARILWTFSAALEVTRDPRDEELAHRAYDELHERFLDPVHGGYVWELDEDGMVVDDSKKTYGQAFAAYALAEYARRFDDDAARDLALNAFDWIERHARDDDHGGYWEVRARDGTPAAELRLSRKDQDAPKSMNNHLHVLEAYTNLYRLAPSEVIARRLFELVELFRSRIASKDGRHLRHFFTLDWTPLGEEYTFGHDIEASWLLCEASDALGDPDLEREIDSLALSLARSARDEGLDSDGGLLYSGADGVIVDDHKEWWPQAEAVVGFHNAHDLSGEAGFLEASRRCWAFIERHLVDRVHGEWYWRVDRAGRPDPTLPKLSFWKCPYHNARACLEILRRTT